MNSNRKDSPCIQISSFLLLKSLVHLVNAFNGNAWLYSWLNDFDFVVFVMNFLILNRDGKPLAEITTSEMRNKSDVGTVMDFIVGEHEFYPSTDYVSKTSG